MKLLTTGVLALLLQGCSSLPPPPPVIETIKVEVPVPVSCAIQWPEKPIAPKFGEDIDTNTALLLKENEENRQYSKELEAVLRGCAKK